MVAGQHTRHGFIDCLKNGQVPRQNDADWIAKHCAVSRMLKAIKCKFEQIRNESDKNDSHDMGVGVQSHTKIEK